MCHLDNQLQAGTALGLSGQESLQQHLQWTATSNSIGLLRVSTNELKHYYNNVTPPLTISLLDLYRTVDVKIPSSLAAGEYLLRVEQIALHQAQQQGGAQFYIACAQIKVTGGGSGIPGPLVSLPGAYGSNDPGIVVDIWSKPIDNYKGPGPSIWTG